MLEELRQKVEERYESRSCLGLLFERGGTLERIVRHILGELGGDVEEPTDPGKEDGWVEVDAGGDHLEMVLEIKSTKNDQFGEDGLKQLHEWKDRGIVIRGKEYKGVFIGNSCVSKPPKERPDPFSDAFIKTARISGLAALKTVDLFEIYMLSKEGRIDLVDFWRKLYDTNGVFDLRHFTEKTSGGPFS